MMGACDPQIEEVNNFFVSQNFPSEEGEVFYFYYQAMDWRNEKGMPLQDWKTAAFEWLWNLEH